ncbi:hypothetical protein HK101_008513, partial [Irineochytrium annulatum]
LPDPSGEIRERIEDINSVADNIPIDVGALESLLVRLNDITSGFGNKPVASIITQFYESVYVVAATPTNLTRPPGFSTGTAPPITSGTTSVGLGTASTGGTAATTIATTLTAPPTITSWSSGVPIVISPGGTGGAGSEMPATATASATVAPLTAPFTPPLNGDTSQTSTSMNALQLVPEAVRRRVLDGVDQELPSCETVSGAVVALIDISGYSAITTELTKIDSSVAGARVRDIVNPPFVTIIEAVHAWGLFSDSQTSGHLDILRATACCLELLQAMRSCYVDLRPSHQPVSDHGVKGIDGKQQLSIHIGMGVGVMHRIQVGEAATDQNAHRDEHAVQPRREYFIAGEAVVNAGEMEGAARKGELAIPDTAKRALTTVLGSAYPFRSASVSGATILSESDNLPDIVAKLRAATAPMSQASPVDVEGILPGPPAHMSPEFLRTLTYIDESLALYLVKQTPMRRRKSSTAGSTQPGRAVMLRSAAATRPPDNVVDGGVNQLRNVSVVFVRLAGLSVARMNEPETLSLVQQIFIMIVGCIRRTNGCLRQFACDDKSASALIVFGLSGFAHERGEEVAAMRTAYEISGKLSVMIGNDFGIGVASGVVLYGIVGNENRADGTCLGAAVNLAARFMTHELSKGRVLCDEIVYTKSIEDFDFTRFADVTFKGFAPMPIYAPVRKVKKANGEQPAGRKSDGLRIFGREAEMGVLQGLVKRWSTGDTTRVIISGPSGAGNQSYGTDVTQGSPFSGLGRLLLSLSAALDGKNASDLYGASIPLGMQNIKDGSLVAPSTTSTLSGSDSIHFVSVFRDLGLGSENSRFASLFKKLGVSKDVLKLFLTVMPNLKDSDDIEFDEKTSFGNETANTISLAITKALNKLATKGAYAVVLVLDDLQWMDATTLDITLDIIILEPLTIQSGTDMIRYALQEVADAGGEVSDDVCNKIYQLAQGQFFNISDIAHVLSLVGEINGPPEDVYEMIRSNDFFHFVTLPNGLSGTCSFSHFLIHQSIVKSLIPSFVENVHLSFVKYYESIFNETNQTMLTPLLVYHLSGVTGNTDRKRKYTKIAFSDAAMNYRFAEATRYHVALQELGLDEETDMADHIAYNYFVLNMYQQRR